MDKKQYAWAWKADSQNYSYLHDSIDECLEEAKKENDGTYEKVFIGIAEEWDSHIDTDSLIESIQQEATWEGDELADDYLENIPKDQFEELDKKLNEVFEEWKNKYGHSSPLFKIKDAKAYNI